MSGADGTITGNDLRERSKYIHSTSIVSSNNSILDSVSVKSPSSTTSSVETLRKSDTKTTKSLFDKVFKACQVNIFKPLWSWIRSVFTLRTLGTIAICWGIYFSILVYAKNLLSFPMIRYSNTLNPVDSLEKLTRYRIWEQYSAVEHITPVGINYSFIRHSHIKSTSHKNIHHQNHQSNKIKNFDEPWSLFQKEMIVAAKSSTLQSPTVSPSTLDTPMTQNPKPSLFLHIYLCGNAQLALSWIQTANLGLSTQPTEKGSDDFILFPPEMNRMANTTISNEKKQWLDKQENHRAVILIDHPGYGVNEGVNHDISRDSVASHITNAVETALQDLYVIYNQNNIDFPDYVGIEFIGYSIGTAAALESGAYLHLRNVHLSDNQQYDLNIKQRQQQELKQKIEREQTQDKHHKTTLLVSQYQLISPPTSLSDVAATLPFVLAPRWLVRLVWPTDFRSLSRASEITKYNDLLRQYIKEKHMSTTLTTSIEPNIDINTDTDADTDANTDANATTSMLKSKTQSGITIPNTKTSQIGRHSLVHSLAWAHSLENIEKSNELMTLLQPIKTLIYHGDQDTLVPMWMGKSIATTCNSELIVLKGHNHVSIIGDEHLENKLGFFRIPSSNIAHHWHNIYIRYLETLDQSKCKNESKDESENMN